MPKLFGKEIHPVVLVGVTGVAIYLVMGALQPPAITLAPAKKKVVDKKATTDVEYTVPDYTAQFASLTGVTPKDAFRPLITKTATGSSQNPNIDNFTYSGMALLNNEPNGLLENSTTGEGDFVQPGQHWHQQWLVVSVTPDQIDLKNETEVGEDTILKVGAGSAKTDNAATASASNSAANAPFNPAMIGQIGGDMSMQPDPSNPMPQNGGGRRRGGRGGGGRGRGGGGGGGNNGQGGNE